MARVSAEAFRARLLDLLPIYAATGRRIAALDLPPVDDRTAALALADAAVRRWARDALAVASEREDVFDGVAGSLRELRPITDAASAALAADVAADVETLARPMGAHPDLVDAATHAAKAATAASEGRWEDAGIAAAGALYARIDAGTEYILSEAEVALIVRGR
jgi:hypothetical protein